MAFDAVLAEFTDEAVVNACRDFCRGLVKRNNGFCPEAPEVAERAREWQAILDSRDEWAERRKRAAALPPPPPGYGSLQDGSLIVPIGMPVPDGYMIEPGTVDFGHGRIDLRGMTAAQVEAVYALGRLPPLAEMEKLATEAWSEEVRQRLLARPTSSSAPLVPRLKRMNDR